MEEDKSTPDKKGVEEEKRGRGRPSNYPDIDLEQVRKLAERGFTDREMAEFFGVCIRTWHYWKKEHSDFFETLVASKAVADARVEHSLYERATGCCHPEEKYVKTAEGMELFTTTKHYPPDTSAAVFWLKNRQPARWRDRQEVEHSSSADLAELIIERRQQLEGDGKK